MKQTYKAIIFLGLSILTVPAMFAGNEVVGKVRINIIAPTLNISISNPSDGVVWFEYHQVNTSTCSYGDARRLEVKNESSVNVTYQLKTGPAVLKDNNNVVVMYPSSEVNVSSFVIYASFYKWNLAPELNDYATNDILTTNYQTATDAIFAIDGKYGQTGDIEYTGMSATPNSYRNIKFRVDLPTALANSSHYGQDIDIPIYVKAILP